MEIGRILLTAVLAAGTGSGAGSGWVNVGPGGGTVAAITFDPHDPSTQYVGSGSGLFKSIDGGTTWNNTGLIGWSIPKIFLDPQNTSTVYVQATYLPDRDADTINKIFRSDDGGATWNDLVTGATLMAVDPQVSGTLYALVGQGLFKSTDSGASWRLITGLPSGLGTFAVAIDWRNHNTLFAAQMGVVSGRNVTTLQKSTDGGVSWKASDTGLPQTFDPGNGTTNVLPFAQNGITIDPTNPNTIYAAKAGTGVYKSTDGGASWKAANLGMTLSPNVPPCCNSGVVIDPQNPNTLYATGGYPVNLTIYKSTSLSPRCDAIRLRPFSRSSNGSSGLPCSGDVQGLRLSETAAGSGGRQQRNRHTFPSITRRDTSTQGLTREPIVLPGWFTLSYAPWWVRI